MGLCQTFNGLPINKILKGSDWLTKFTEEFETAEDKPIHNAYGIGEDKGFVFVVDNMYSPKLTRGTMCDPRKGLDQLFVYRGIDRYKVP